MKKSLHGARAPTPPPPPFLFHTARSHGVSLRVCPLCARACGWAWVASQINLGIAFANGAGVAQSDADAVRWLSAAKDAGLAAEAQQVRARPSFRGVWGRGGGGEGEGSLAFRVFFLVLAAESSMSFALRSVHELCSSCVKRSWPRSPRAFWVIGAVFVQIIDEILQAKKSSSSGSLPTADGPSSEAYGGELAGGPGRSWLQALLAVGSVSVLLLAAWAARYGPSAGADAAPESLFEQAD